MSDTAITATNLVRAFDSKKAVDGVHLEVAAGEIYGFLGPNGAGKSTTVRMLCTLLRPTSGAATVAGFDVIRQPGKVRLHIGVALQEAALDPKQTGEEILKLQARLFGLTGREVSQRLDALATLVDIGDALKKPVGTYSGGMKRRLDLAAALVHNPDVLFLDEPTTGLDPVSRARVWEEVQSLNTELGMTIFLTTQYLEEADALADRVGIIDQGRIVAEGTPDELKRSIGSDVIVVEVATDADRAAETLRALTGIDQVDQRGDEILVRTTDGAAALSPVAVALNDVGIRVKNLTLRTPTLDDVFLELTGTRIEGNDQ
jgi:ABC-2 type transport system ATP-binding protein